MAGYRQDFSMSNNAYDAYEDGEQPLSKWTRKAILDEVKRVCPQQYDLFKNLPLAVLRKNLLTKTSWHHTSAKYNKTDFYAIDEVIIDEYTDEDVEEWLEEYELEKHKDVPKRRLANVAYIEWVGSRTRPRPKHHYLNNVEVEERGSFYYIYQDGELILKKKIGSNGTEVEYIRRGLK